MKAVNTQETVFIVKGANELSNALKNIGSALKSVDLNLLSTIVGGISALSGMQKDNKFVLDFDVRSSSGYDKAIKGINQLISKMREIPQLADVLNKNKGIFKDFQEIAQSSVVVPKNFNKENISGYIKQVKAEMESLVKQYPNKTDLMSKTIYPQFNSLMMQLKQAHKIAVGGITPGMTVSGEKFGTIADVVGNFKNIFTGLTGERMGRFSAVRGIVGGEIQKNFADMATTTRNTILNVIQDEINKRKLQIQDIRKQKLALGRGKDTLLQRNDLQQSIGEVQAEISDLIVGKNGILSAKKIQDMYAKDKNVLVAGARKFSFVEGKSNYLLNKDNLEKMYPQLKPVDGKFLSSEINALIQRKIKDYLAFISKTPMSELKPSERAKFDKQLFSKQQDIFGLNYLLSDRLKVYSAKEEEILSKGGTPSRVSSKYTSEKARMLLDQLQRSPIKVSQSIISELEKWVLILKNYKPGDVVTEDIKVALEQFKTVKKRAENDIKTNLKQFILDIQKQYKAIPASLDYAKGKYGSLTPDQLKTIKERLASDRTTTTAQAKIYEGQIKSATTKEEFDTATANYKHQLILLQAIRQELSAINKLGKGSSLTTGADNVVLKDQLNTMMAIAKKQGEINAKKALNKGVEHDSSRYLDMSLVVYRKIQAIQENIRKNKGIATDLEAKQLSSLQKSYSYWNTLGQATSETNRNIKDTVKQFFSMEKLISRMSFVWTAMFSYQIAGSINQIVMEMTQGALQLERAMRRIESIMTTWQKQYAPQIEKAMMLMMTKYGQNIEEIGKATYELVSSNIEPRAIPQVLEASTKMAVTGLTDVNQATNLMISGINAYGYSIDQLTDLSDLFFQMVKYGRTTIEELNKNFGVVSSTASMFGIDIKDVATALSIMTNRGIDTNQAITAMNQLLLNFSKGGTSEKARKAFEKYFKGMEMNAESLRKLGIEGLIKGLKGATDVELTAIAGTVRAVKVLASAISDTKTYHEFYQHMVNASGSTELAYQEIQKNTMFQMKQMRNQFVAFGMSIVKDLLPAVKALVNMFSGLSTVLGVSNSKGIISLLVAVTATGLILKLASQVTTLSKSVGGLGNAFLMVGKNFSGVLLLITALDLLVNKLIATRYSVDDLKKSVDDLDVNGKETVGSYNQMAVELEKNKKIYDKFRNSVLQTYEVIKNTARKSIKEQRFKELKEQLLELSKEYPKYFSNLNIESLTLKTLETDWNKYRTAIDNTSTALENNMETRKLSIRSQAYEQSEMELIKKQLDNDMIIDEHMSKIRNWAYDKKKFEQGKGPGLTGDQMWEKNWQNPATGGYEEKSRTQLITQLGVDLKSGKKVDISKFYSTVFPEYRQAKLNELTSSYEVPFDQKMFDNIYYDILHINATESRILKAMKENKEALDKAPKIESLGRKSDIPPGGEIIEGQDTTGTQWEELKYKYLRGLIKYYPDAETNDEGMLAEAKKIWNQKKDIEKDRFAEEYASFIYNTERDKILKTIKLLKTKFNKSKDDPSLQEAYKKDIVVQIDTLTELFQMYQGFKAKTFEEGIKPKSELEGTDEFENIFLQSEGLETTLETWLKPLLERFDKTEAVVQYWKKLLQDGLAQEFGLTNKMLNDLALKQPNEIDQETVDMIMSLPFIPQAVSAIYRPRKDFFDKAKKQFDNGINKIKSEMDEELLRASSGGAVRKFLGINDVEQEINWNYNAKLKSSYSNTIATEKEKPVKDRNYAVIREAGDELLKLQESELNSYVNGTKDALDQLTQVWDMFYQNQIDKVNELYDEKKDKLEKSAKIEHRSSLWLETQQEKLDKKRDKEIKKWSAIKKALSISEAVINTNVAITNALKATPNPLFNLALATLMGITGFASVAMISAQKMAKGGLILGPSHNNGGVMVEAEGKEFMFSKKATEGNEAYLYNLQRSLEMGKSSSNSGYDVGAELRKLTQMIMERPVQIIVQNPISDTKLYRKVENGKRKYKGR